MKHALLVLLCTVASGQDHTVFQAAHPYIREIDIASDVAIVYGVNESFGDRVSQWQAEGYGTSMMTGISWGDYGDYYVVDGIFRKDEVQTSKSGRVYMHGNSTTVGYNVPSGAYLAYIKEKIRPAIRKDIRAIYLEEPEYWAETGWSAGFKTEWERFYGTPWEAPDSSVGAQYKASRLKYELYFRALEDVIGFIKEEATKIDHAIECHVPTHSLLNYAHWRIVSPESHLTDIPGMDGYIAQVWTGTSRTPNVYRGERRERTFDTAYLEYGQMWAMVRPTGRKVWFLHDPIEDNPNHTWADYQENYACTVVASLLWPEVSRFEVLPWPNRIFRGQYPKAEGDGSEGMPAPYATQLLAVINALNDMDHPADLTGFGQRGIGVVVSDTLMFQRAAPKASDESMGHVYGLALPLLKNGVPVEIVQLENVTGEDALAPYDVLLLTYEGQKPLKAAYHDALAAWVAGGGNLIVVDDGKDPYHEVPEWWNEHGAARTTATEALLDRLGVPEGWGEDAYACGDGAVFVRHESPSELTRRDDGAQQVLDWVAGALARTGATLTQKNHLCLQRGPYRIATVLDESCSDKPLVLEGNFVDLFDPALPVLTRRVLESGHRTVLVDLDWYRAQGRIPAVVAGACRIREERVGPDGTLRFTTRGPVNTRARVRCLLPEAPSGVHSEEDITFVSHWDAESSTLVVEFDNAARDQSFAVTR